MTLIIKKVNRIPTHCGVAYECARSLARGHVIRVWSCDVCTMTFCNNVLYLRPSNHGGLVLQHYSIFTTTHQLPVDEHIL